jgi:hypothetical protein
MINLNNLWENKEEVIRRCRNKQACVTEFTKLIKANNEEDFKQVILNNFGWVNRKQIIDEPKFDCAGGFQDGLAMVKIDKKYGYIKTDGSYIVKPKFDDAWSFKEGVAWVKVGKKYGYIKPDGSYLIEPKFDEAGDFHEGIARVRVDENWGYIKPNGLYMIEPKFDYAWSFHEGIARVRVDGVEYLINTKGERI